MKEYLEGLEKVKLEDRMYIYDDYNEQESLWSKFLNEKGICKSGYGGNRPCDNGSYCNDICNADWVQKMYEKYKEVEVNG